MLNLAIHTLIGEMLPESGQTPAFLPPGPAIWLGFQMWASRSEISDMGSLLNLVYPSDLRDPSRTQKPARYHTIHNNVLDGTANPV